MIKGSQSGKAPFVILAQLHGNEPAGLAGILLALALAEAGQLKRDVIGVVGNPHAAKQYFAALAAEPRARQETRDQFRCGIDEKGALLPDMNRIPVDFMTREPVTPHVKRARELYALGERISGILDIHSARGNMTCITDHKRDADLKNSPIRAVLVDLAEAISANASTTVTVKTLKTILSPLPNIECQTGIEAGRHESPEAPGVAASFTLSTLHTLGITDIAPVYDLEDGEFEGYAVKPRITYADLKREFEPGADDRIYMAISCPNVESIPNRSDRVIIRKKDGSYAAQSILEFIVNPGGELAYAIYQYDEMEPIKKGQVVAVALPSGVEFKAPASFSGIFLSKSGKLYDKDPAVGPWPVAVNKLNEIKFCYPCDVKKLNLSF